MLPNSVVPSSIWHLLWNSVCPSVICPFGDAFCRFPFVPLSFLNNLSFWSIMASVSSISAQVGFCAKWQKEENGPDQCRFLTGNSQILPFQWLFPPGAFSVSRNMSCKRIASILIPVLLLPSFWMLVRDVKWWKCLQCQRVFSPVLIELALFWYIFILHYTCIYVS